MPPYRKILVIDDDEDDLEIFQVTLSAINSAVQCHLLTDPDTAWEMLVHKILEPDLIVLDYNMPNMSGVELLTLLKGHEQLKKIPVVLLTSASDPGIAAETKKRGAQDYLVKPTRYSEMKDILNVLLLKRYPME